MLGSARATLAEREVVLLGPARIGHAEDGDREVGLHLETPSVRSVAHRRLHRRIHTLEARDDLLIGDSTAMRALRELVARVAPHDATVLVLGESGTRVTEAEASDDALFGPDELVPMHEIERRYVRHVMGHVRGNKRSAARVLGFDRKTLYRKLERYGVASED